MCKNLVRRAWRVAVVVLFTAGVAACQMAPLPFQNNIAWGGPIQPPDVGSGDNHSQPGTSSGAYGETPGENSADTPDQTPSDNAADTSAGGNANGPANSNTGSANPDNTVRQLGTPFPLQLQPQGLKIGPFYVPSISDSFFYAVNTYQGEPTQTFVGNSLTANLVYSRPLSRGTFAFQAREQFSLSEGHPYLNQTAVANFNEQFTDRWSLSASAAFTYFQNSILSNPQYILGYTNSGVVQQTLFVQQQGYNIYDTNTILLSYRMGERTQITLSPIIGATFQYLEGGWSNVHQLGGAVSITRSLTPNLSVGGSYSLSHSATSGAASTTPSWNSQYLGVNFQYIFGQSWSVAGSLSANGQLVAQVWSLSPTGTLRLMKSFHQSSITAAYTRAEASNVFISTGYYQQADIAYNQSIGKKVNINAGVGAYQTINTGAHQYGKRFGGGFNYQWLPRLGLNANYNFAHQSGAQALNFSPFLGNVSYFSVGLNWSLGSQSGL